MNARAYLAELLGTFLFFVIGMSSIQAVGALGAAAPLLVVVPLAFGFGLLAAIITFGHISGAHFNPAVTIAMTIDERLSPMDAVGYVISQVIGALGASALVLVLWNQAAVAATITAPGSGFSDVQALILETVLTAMFLLVILTASKHASALAPLAIPLTLAGIHFAAVPFTGASFNPARSLAPALLGGDLSKLWIYLVAPIVGAIIAALIFRALDRIPVPASAA
ncbi:MAG: aquaporin [Chloroflexota bacterium]|jgi:aquaporin Z|nr:aquaporin [Chloroflexota bacterium]